MSFPTTSRFQSSHYLTSNATGHNYSRHYTGSSGAYSNLNRYPASGTGSAGRANFNNTTTTYGSSYQPNYSHNPITKVPVVTATRGLMPSNSRPTYRLPPDPPSISRNLDPLHNSKPLPSTPPPAYKDAIASSPASTLTAAATISSKTEESPSSTKIGTFDISQRHRGGRVGLSNLGNTCYMNCIVQCLSHTKPLLELVLDCKDDQGLPDNGPVSGPFKRLLKELWSPDPVSSYARPSELRVSMGRYAQRFSGYGQQDAGEFMRFLLEALHEDSKRNKSTGRNKYSRIQPIDFEELDKLSDLEKSKLLWERYISVDSSPIIDIFVGQLKSTLECCHCGHKTTTFDPFWDLSLSIPRGRSTDLQSCLKLFTSRETLEGDEMPTCEKCKARRKCDKSFSLYRLPKILVVNLLRFTREGFRTKLDTLVDYPFDLDLTPFVDAESRQANKFGTRYSLYGVSEHSGTTLSGHYTATVRHAYDRNKWMAFNDTRVSNSTAEAAVSSLGYVLFYEAVDSSAQTNGSVASEREP
uniref:Ubiquitin carboxyl-terminal hydrolase n=2 Tax=Macrostomum lignano TaxID=282301 RepID=A0A1I8HI93_9PLAT